MPGMVERMELCRALPLAGAITVTVKSWNTYQQTAFVQSASNGGQGTPQTYAIVRPNLTPDQAQALAQQTLAQIVAHQWSVSAHMPGDVITSARSGLEGVSISGVKPGRAPKLKRPSTSG